MSRSSSSGTVEHQYFDGPGIDQIFADEDALREVLWPLADAQGTVRDLAGVDSGITSVLNHRTLDSFGNMVAETDNTVDHNFAFAGRHWDEDAGSYYNRARWYDPESGSFISEDPLGFGAGDTNVTRYSGNNPVNYIDPTGLFWKRIVNVFKDIVDDVGDFYEDAFDDIGDAFEDVDDFIGEQWDNGNIQKVLLGAATIISAGVFAPLAMGGFSAMAVGGTFAGGFASAAATSLGLASVAASPGLVAAYAASTTLGFASAGVSSYEVFSGDQIGDGTLTLTVANQRRVPWSYRR